MLTDVGCLLDPFPPRMEGIHRHKGHLSHIAQEDAPFGRGWLLECDIN